MLIRALAVWIFTVVAFSLGFSMTSSADPLVINTEQGKVLGKTINDGKVRAYLGIPYAAPPVGDLRWKAPALSAKWKGTRDSTRFGARCAQNLVFDDMVFQDSGPSEDCLFVNVYVPAGATSKRKLPVMLWIHGGSYEAGAGSEPRHNGDFLPLKGVVLVTINYRLGVFGFLVANELAAEANSSAGNYGLMDMVAALHWVHANIDKFGGDPHNVTIFGESSGSFAVSTLMASPLAQGLFQKAIGESGAEFSDALPTDSLEARERKDGEWVASLGVKSLKELRALSTKQILDAVKQQNASFDSVVDGRLLTEPVSAVYAAGKQAQVPLIAGWNMDEGGFIPAQPITPAQWTATAQKTFPDRWEEFLKLYPGDSDAQSLRSAIDYRGDAFIAFGTWKWLEAHRKTGNAPVYRYHFELAALPSKYNPGTFAFHSDDIEYVFGTLDTRPGETVRPEDRKLSEEMMTYWTNFARTGDPNGEGVPAWPKYASRDELIHLNAPVTSGPDTLRPRYEFLLKGIPDLQF